MLLYNLWTSNGRNRTRRNKRRLFMLDRDGVSHCPWYLTYNTSILKTKSRISHLITIYKVWFPWLALIGQYCWVLQQFSATWFGRYCPYWRKCVRGLGMNCCTSVWLFNIYIIIRIWMRMKTVLQHKWWLHIAEVDEWYCALWVLQRWGK